MMQKLVQKFPSSDAKESDKTTKVMTLFINQSIKR